MKKEEQKIIQNNSDGSFFKGAEKTESFFDGLKKIFLGNVEVESALPAKKEVKIIENKPKDKKEDTVIISKPEITKNDKPKVIQKKETSIPVNKVSAWSAPSILSTNLIKGESTIIHYWDKNVTMLVMNIFLAFFVIIIFYGGLFIWQKRSQAEIIEINAKIAEKQAIINQKRQASIEINNFNKKTVLIKKMLENHIYWEGFFTFFENNILKNVYLPDTISASINGEYLFTAATKDLETMLDQVNYLRSLDSVLSAEISNVSFIKSDGATMENGNQDVVFDLSVKIDKDKIFYKK